MQNVETAKGVWTPSAASVRTNVFCSTTAVASRTHVSDMLAWSLSLPGGYELPWWQTFEGEYLIGKVA